MDPGNLQQRHAANRAVLGISQLEWLAMLKSNPRLSEVGRWLQGAHTHMRTHPKHSTPSMNSHPRTVACHMLPAIAVHARGDTGAHRGAGGAVWLQPGGGHNRLPQQHNVSAAGLYAGCRRWPLCLRWFRILGRKLGGGHNRLPQQHNASAAGAQTGACLPCTATVPRHT